MARGIRAGTLSTRALTFVACRTTTATETRVTLRTTRAPARHGSIRFGTSFPLTSAPRGHVALGQDGASVAAVQGRTLCKRLARPPIRCLVSMRAEPSRERETSFNRGWKS